jgi:hypothetical protein
VRDEVDNGAGGVTVSLGVAPFDLFKGVNARDALRSADAAMYTVKRSGRNGYAVAGVSEGPHHARSRADLAARSGWAGRPPGASSLSYEQSRVADLSAGGPTREAARSLAVVAPSQHQSRKLGR